MIFKFKDKQAPELLQNLNAVDRLGHQTEPSVPDESGHLWLHRGWKESTLSQGQWLSQCPQAKLCLTPTLNVSGHHGMELMELTASRDHSSLQTDCLWSRGGSWHSLHSGRLAEMSGSTDGQVSWEQTLTEWVYTQTPHSCVRTSQSSAWSLCPVAPQVAVLQLSSLNALTKTSGPLLFTSLAKQACNFTWKYKDCIPMF